MNSCAEISESGWHSTVSWHVPGPTTINSVRKPKLLPWLARSAGMPEQAVHALWNEALALAGADACQTGEPHRQAAAMQYLLLMLRHAGATPGGMTVEAGAALATICI
jgi:hypothetical protein